MRTLDEATARRAVTEAADLASVPPGDVEDVLRRGRRRRFMRRTFRGVGSVVVVVLAVTTVLALVGDRGEDEPVAAGPNDPTESTSAAPRGEWFSQPTLGVGLPEGPAVYDGRTVTLTEDLTAPNPETVVSVSEDGITWTTAKRLPGLPGRLLADDNGFLAAIAGQNEVTLWASTDGQHWDLVQTLPITGAVLRMASGPTGTLLVAQDNVTSELAWMSDKHGRNFRPVPFDLAERSLAASADLGNVDAQQPLVSELVANKHAFVAVVETAGTNQVPHVWSSTDGLGWSAVAMPASDRSELYGKPMQQAVATQDEFWFAARSLWRAGPDLRFSQVAIPHLGSIHDLAGSADSIAVLVSRLAPLVLVTEAQEITLGDEAVIRDRETDRVVYQSGEGEYQADMSDGLRLLDSAGTVVLELNRDEAAAAVERAGGPPTDSTSTVLTYSEGTFTEVAAPTPEPGSSLTLDLVGDVMYLSTLETTYTQRTP